MNFSTLSSRNLERGHTVDADLGVGAFYSDAEAGRWAIGVGLGEFGAICDVVGGAELAGDVLVCAVDLGDLRDRKIDAAP
ncbi:MAG: hypothetical protein KF762_03045 [Acidobacteria bacterium]|nr:hypothetical protein [Acidobacteriota bacterium]